MTEDELRKAAKAAYMRKWRREKIAADPAWADRERKRNERWLARRLREDPDWKNRVNREGHARRAAADPDYKRNRLEETNRWRAENRDHVNELANARNRADRVDPVRGAILRARARERAARKRTEVIEMLGARCAHCGSKDSSTFEIDHIHGGGKREPAGYPRWVTLLAMARDQGVRRLRKHVQVLCRKCHRIKTREERATSL